MRKITEVLKDVFRIREGTPQFIINGFIGCALSAILIAIRLILYCCSS